MPHSRAKREVMITMAKIKPGNCDRKTRNQGKKPAEKKPEQEESFKNLSTNKRVDLSSILKGFRR